MGEESPEGWADVAITDICDLNPAKPSTSEVAGDAEVTFVPMSAVDADSRAITKPQVRTFEEVRKGFTSFRDNDVIVAKITPCFENGKAAVCRGLLNGVGFGSTEFHVLRTNGSVLPEYVYRFVQQDSFLGAGEANMTGSVGQKRVPAAWLGSKRIPLPPLAEQRRIVAQVDALLTRIQAARARLAKVPALLKRFRQSVLAAACSGQLTADWRECNPATESAAEMVHRVHQQRAAAISRSSKSRHDSRNPISRTVEGLPDTWCQTRIGDIADCLDSLRVPVNREARQTRAGKIPYYGANGQVGWIAEFLFDENLVLVVEDESFIGREKPFSYVIKGKSWVNNHAHVLRLLGGGPAEYLDACLAYYDFVPLTSGTTGRRKLNKGTLLDAELPIAPLHEQCEIVCRINALFALSDKIEARVTAATARVGKITQAILAKAFRGELVPTEAELARQEGRGYEPASVLLERIGAEREAAGQGQPRKKSRRNVTAKSILGDENCTTPVDIRRTDS